MGKQATQGRVEKEYNRKMEEDFVKNLNIKKKTLTHNQSRKNPPSAET